MRTLLIVAVALFAGNVFAAKAADNFKELDANSDGRVTAAEYERANASKFTLADGNRDGTLTKGELVGFMVDDKGKSGKAAENKAAAKISKLDVNGDGMLTRDEYSQGFKQQFTAIDKNTDGALTIEEMESWQAL